MAAPRKPEGRPDLVCAFCESTTTFAGIINLWTHFVQKHNDVQDTKRLSEIRRTATMWIEYWKNYSDGGKRGNATMAKLQQIGQEGYSWSDVEAWGLR